MSMLFKVLFLLAISIDIICVYLSHLWWYGWVVKSVLQYVGCLGEGQGPSWANVEGWQSSTFPQAPTRVACSLGKGVKKDVVPV